MPQQVADDIHVSLVMETRESKKTLVLTGLIWYNTLKDEILRPL